MSKHYKMATEILEALGGSENVASATNCITRLRVKPVDKSKINEAALKKVEGVLGTVDDDTYQIILGPGVVTKVAEEFTKLIGNGGGSKGTSAEELKAKGAEIKAQRKEKNNTPVKNFLKQIGNIFVPLIPAFVGAGLIGGVSAIMSNNITAGNMDAETWGQIVVVLNIIKNGLFSYLVIYVGISSAKEFGGTQMLGGIIGGTTLLMGMNPDLPLLNIFTGAPLKAGQGGVIGVIFAVWLLCYLEKKLRKVIPDSIDIIVTPTIALIVVGLATIFFIMPLAGFVSDNLVGAITWTLEQGGAFAGFVLGASFLPLVLLGLHQVLTPIHLEMINASGSTQLLPILAMAGAGQVGASIAVWMRCRKNKSLTNTIKGALPVGILGIGEPLIYGVTLPLGRPFITACIGGGIGGAVLGLVGNVGAITVGPSGVALIPLIADGRWLMYVLGLLSAYAGGFVVTYFFGVPEEAMTEQE